ncbi:pyocin activator PrtN family protein [Zooshikella ganghwensis]|nr:pyocin activator PrtN family protein [Zooshikella ganghwensis]
MAFKLNTVLLLMAEHGKTVIPLNDVCEKYLGLNPQTATYRASTHQLPFNTFFHIDYQNTETPCK